MLQRAAGTRFSVPAWLVFSVCLTPVLGHADSINTQVSCYTAGESSATGSNTCSVAGTTGSATDNLQLTVVHALSASDYTTVLLSENGVAQSAQGSNNPGQNLVLSSASLNLTFRTTGPERAGYLEVATPSSLDTEWAVANLTYSIGVQQGDCYLHTSECTFGSTPPVTSLLPDRFFSFTLGDPFRVQLSYTDSFATQQDSFISPVSGSFALQFRFFESDAVTPVAVNPEPGTWGLLCMVILASALFSLRRRFCFRRLSS